MIALLLLMWTAAAAELVWLPLGAEGEESVQTELALGLDDITVRSEAPPEAFITLPAAAQVDALRAWLAEEGVVAAAWLDPRAETLQLHVVFATENRAVLRLVEGRTGEEAQLALAVRELLAGPQPAPEPEPSAPEPTAEPPPRDPPRTWLSTAGGVHAVGAPLRAHANLGVERSMGPVQFGLSASWAQGSGDRELGGAVMVTTPIAERAQLRPLLSLGLGHRQLSDTGWTAGGLAPRLFAGAQALLPLGATTRVGAHVGAAGLPVRDVVDSEGGTVLRETGHLDLSAGLSLLFSLGG